MCKCAKFEPDKCQLISKGLFGNPQFSQKTNEKIRLYQYDTSGRLVFVRFLGEIEATKKAFRKLTDLQDKLDI